MALSVVAPTTPLEAVLERSSYILGELASHPLAAPYSIKLDSFQADWFVAHRQRTLLIVTKNDRKAALYSLLRRHDAWNRDRKGADPSRARQQADL